MTDPEIDQRLRIIEDWCIKHDVECAGRTERFLHALETVRTSVGVTSEIARQNDKRLDEYDIRWAKLSGVAGLAALVGSILGKVLGL